MPFVTIINATCILCGLPENPAAGNFRWDPPEGHAREVYEELIYGACLRKLVATPATEFYINQQLALVRCEPAICGWSFVDLDDAREFLKGRVSTKGSPRREQMRLMKAVAQEMAIDLQAPKFR